MKFVRSGKRALDKYTPGTNGFVFNRGGGSPVFFVLGLVVLIGNSWVIQGRTVVVERGLSGYSW